MFQAFQQCISFVKLLFLDQFATRFDLEINLLHWALLLASFKGCSPEFQGLPSLLSSELLMILINFSLSTFPAPPATQHKKAIQITIANGIQFFIFHLAQRKKNHFGNDTLLVNYILDLLRDYHFYFYVSFILCRSFFHKGGLIFRGNTKIFALRYEVKVSARCRRSYFFRHISNLLKTCEKRNFLTDLLK